MRSLSRSRQPTDPGRDEHCVVSCRSGMTLIEVIAALAILGTVLTASIMARGRFVQQDRSARHRINAAPVADRLLEGWWRQPDELPHHGRGSADGYFWRTSTRDDEQLTRWGVSVLRLELWRQGDSVTINTESYDTKQPDLAVELLVPRHEPDRLKKGGV